MVNLVFRSWTLNIDLNLKVLVLFADDTAVPEQGEFRVLHLRHAIDVDVK